MWVALVLLLACTRLLPEKGTVPAQGKKKMLAMVALLASMAVPAEGRNFFAWWRVRHSHGTFWFVWPGGFWEELSPDWQDAMQGLASQEPEMMAYIMAQSQVPGPEQWPQQPGEWPPTWHIASQMWVMSRLEPDGRLTWVAQPENMDDYVHDPLVEENYGGDSMEDTPGYTVPFHAGPSSASDGNQHVMTDGTVIHAWSGRPAQGYQPAQGYYSGASSSSQPAQGSHSSSSSSSSWWSGWQDGWHSGWQSSCGWQDQQGWYWPGQGHWRSRKSNSPAPPPGPPNPNRYFNRGRGAQKKREERRKYEHQGKPVPEHLKPQAQRLNKAAKQQMYLIHQRAKRMAEAQSQEELDQLAEELAELQQKEAAALESLKKAKNNKTKEEPEKAKEEPEERQPKPYMGKNRGHSLDRKGTPSQVPKHTLGKVPAQGNEKEQEDEEMAAADEPWPASSSSEGSRGKKRSQRSTKPHKRPPPVPEEGKETEGHPDEPQDKRPDKGPEPDGGGGAAGVTA